MSAGEAHSGRGVCAPTYPSSFLQVESRHESLWTRAADRGGGALLLLLPSLHQPCPQKPAPPKLKSEKVREEKVRREREESTALEERKKSEERKQRELKQKNAKIRKAQREDEGRKLFEAPKGSSSKDRRPPTK